MYIREYIYIYPYRASRLYACKCLRRTFDFLESARQARVPKGRCSTPETHQSIRFSCGYFMSFRGGSTPNRDTGESNGIVTQVAREPPIDPSRTQAFEQIS